MPPARSLPGCSRPEPWPRRCRPPLRAAAACTGASSSGERRRRGRGTGRVVAGRGWSPDRGRAGAPLGRGQEARAEDAGPPPHTHTRGPPASAPGSGFTFGCPRGSHFPWEAVQLVPDLGLLVGDLERRQALAREETFFFFLLA